MKPSSSLCHALPMVVVMATLVAMVTADEDEDHHDDHDEKPENSEFVYKRATYVMPWKKGPNMCAYYRYADGGSSDVAARFYADCLVTEPKPVCGRPLKVEYECCEGFSKFVNDEAGCTRVAPVEGLTQTLKQLNVTVLPIAKAGMARTLSKGRALTAFIPIDHAVSTAPERVFLALADRFDSLIKYHLYRGRLTLNDITRVHETVTMLNGEKAVLNVQCNSMRTINCARILLPDRQVTNGIIHLIDRVIVPLSGLTENLMSLLKAEPKFSRFHGYLMANPALQDLLANQGPYTMLVPTNQALDRLPAHVQKRLTNPEVLESFLKQHMIGRPLCTVGITRDRTYSSLAGTPIKLSCGPRYGSLLVNDRIPTTETDHVTGNGVIHVLDDALLPDTALTPMELADKLGATEFIKLVDRVGMREEIDKKGDVTFFIPSNEAFEDLPKQLQSRLENDTFVRQLLRYHVAEDRNNLKEAVLGTQYKTSVNGKETKIPVSVIRNIDGAMVYSVQGSEVTDPDIQGADFNMNLMRSLLIPPQYTAMDILNKDPSLSQFVEVFMKAGGRNLLKSLKGKFTLIVPNDHAWEHLERDLREEMDDEKQLRRIIRYHIWPEVYYSTSFKRNFNYYVKAHLGEKVSINVDHDEIVLNSRVHVSDADIPTLEGGVVHVVEEILRCRCPFRRRPSYWRRVG